MKMNLVILALLAASAPAYADRDPLPEITAQLKARLKSDFKKMDAECAKPHNSDYPQACKLILLRAGEVMDKAANEQFFVDIGKRDLRTAWLVSSVTACQAATSGTADSYEGRQKIITSVPMALRFMTCWIQAKKNLADTPRMRPRAPAAYSAGAIDRMQGSIDRMGEIIDRSRERAETKARDYAAEEHAQKSEQLQEQQIREIQKLHNTLRYRR